MAVSLILSSSVSYPSDTTATISVTLKAKSTNGSYNLTSSSYGYIKINGTKYGNFSHTFKANTTTTLGTKSHSVSRTTSAQSISIYGWWHTDVSSGNISKSGTQSVAARPVYTVTFNANGGTGSTSVNVSSGYTATFPYTSRTGYTFGSWGGYAQGATTPAITSSRTYTASWTLNNYKITYDLDGGIINSQPTVYTVTSSAITLPNPTKEGYYFVGWTGTNGSTPQQNVVIPAGSIGNREYVANWRLNVYNINLNANGGTVNPETLLKTHGVDISLPTPHYVAHLFAGWSYNNNNIGTTFSSDGSNDAEIINLIAVWSDAVRPVIFHYYNNIDNINNTYQIYKVKNTIINILPQPIITNYRLDGWYDNADFTGSKITTIDNTYDFSDGDPRYESPDENAIHLYAKWIRQYTISFNSGQNLVLNDNILPTGSRTSITLDAGSNSNQLGSPATYFTYDGGGCYATLWKDDDTLVEYNSTSTINNIQRDISLSPKWILNSYNITLTKGEAISGNNIVTSQNYWTTYTFPNIAPSSWTPPANCYISAWKSGDTIVLPGTQITVTSDSTWEAQWINGYNIPIITSLEVQRYLDDQYTTLNSGGKYLYFEATGQHGSYKINGQSVVVDSHIYNVDIKFYDTVDVNQDSKPIATFYKDISNSETTFSETWRTIDKTLNMRYCILTIIDMTNYGNNINIPLDQRTFIYNFIVPLERAIAIHIADDNSAISLFRELDVNDKGLIVKNQATFKYSVNIDDTATVGRDPIKPLEVATKKYVDETNTRVKLIVWTEF